jgi:hypothetical protein
MTAALRALLEGVFDYAGMFPPANLPLDEAVRNYARYAASPTAWLLGNFVAPAARLPDLDGAVAKYFDSAMPLTVSVVGQGGDDGPSWLWNWREDLKRTRAFLDAHITRVAAPAMEVKLPPDLLGTPTPEEAIVELLDDAAMEAGKEQLPEFDLFLEAPTIHWCCIAESIGRWRDARGTNPPFWVGMKLRAGGRRAEDFLSTQEVAAAIRETNSRVLRWKATAGLHHPLRGQSEESGGRAHGFLNLLVAVVMTDAAGVSDERVREILDDEEPTHFVFDDRGCYWKDWDASLDQIRAVRRKHFASIGSCSFDEPRTGLEQLQLLASEATP